MKIIPIDQQYIGEAKKLLEEQWGSKYIVTKGKIYDSTQLPAFIAVENDKLAGLITYCIYDGKCEIVTLNCLIENRGIGWKLIEKVIEAAKSKKCSYVFLITTNDNTRAIRYYQKRGFYLKAVHLNAIQKSRILKPEIPLLGYDDIPILHEFEFEMEI